MKLEIEEVANGYTVKVTDSQRKGDYVFRAIDDKLMLEFVGKLITTVPVKVERK